MTELNLTLPFTNPVLIFFLVLTIILLAPLLLHKVRIPHIIGMILAGVLVGPYGVGILQRDSSFEIFGQVGLLYLMFLAGLEMDFNDFKKNKRMGLAFGLYTFFVPMILGTLAAKYLLNLSWVTSILLASMYASHTLVAYPLVSRFGISRARSVTITIAGTIVTVAGALVILAVITGSAAGEINLLFWVRLVTGVLLYCAFVIYSFPRLTRWFLKSYDDNVTQYIFVLALVFAASFLAEVAGLEAILGAFLAGVVLNRYIPSVSPLMNRIEFVGNALFIPYFLIGVGMLIDVRALFASSHALVVALHMSVIATLSKWIAAWLTQKSFRLSKLDRQMIFGLSNAQAAATLAAVMIGYRLNLFNADILNGTIVMILITCTISSFVTERAASQLAQEELKGDALRPMAKDAGRMLIPVANPLTSENLVNMALLMRNKQRNNPLFGLYVVSDSKVKEHSRQQAERVLEVAGRTASAADVTMSPLVRFDLNIASGIIHTVREHKITEVVIGLHEKANIVDTFLGSLTESLLKGANCMIAIARCFIPTNMTTRIVVAVPAKAEYETGFVRWVDCIANMAKQIGCRAIFYAHTDTIPFLKGVLAQGDYRIRSEFEVLKSWDHIAQLSQVVIQDDLFCVITARRTSISYDSRLEQLPQILSRNFESKNLLVIYPEQFGAESDITFFSDPMANTVQHTRLFIRWGRALRGFLNRG